VSAQAGTVSTAALDARTLERPELSGPPDQAAIPGCCGRDLDRGGHLAESVDRHGSVLVGMGVDPDDDLVTGIAVCCHGPVPLVATVGGTPGRDGGQDTWDAGQRSYQVTSARPVGARRNANGRSTVQRQDTPQGVSHTLSQAGRQRLDQPIVP